MKILFVSRPILPAKGGSVIITEKLAKQFQPDEMVVLGSRGFFDKKVERPETQPKFYYQYGQINIKGKGDRFFVIFRYLLFPFLLWKIYRVLKKEHCDYIIAVFPEIFFCYAAHLVSKWTETPFSTYFHNTYLENRPKGHRYFFAKRWQPKIFEHSENIFVMSEGMKNYYEKSYSKKYKFVPLLHTFSKYPEKEMQPPSFHKEKYKLVLIGNFNASNVEATARLVDTVKKDKRFEIYFYTHVPTILLKNRGIDVSAIHQMGFINDDLLIEELRKYDICVLTHGFGGNYSEVEYETIFPTRTIPFLLCGRPIFAHSPSGAFITDFLKKYDCAEVVDEAKPQLIIEALEQITENKERREVLLHNARETAQQFYGPNVADTLKQRIFPS